MTDVLLAHSFFIKNDPKQLDKMRPYAPLATLYAASHLREKGYSVAVFDATFADGVGDFERLLRQLRPRYLALYEDMFNFLNKMCLDHTREAARRMSESARSLGTTVIAAGSDVTDDPGAYFSHGVQYALVGEADRSLIELIDALSSGDGQSLDSIAGLVRPDSGAPEGVRRNCARPPERYPDSFPFPAWDLLDAESYRNAWREAHGYFSLNMASTRGCPFHCNWCAKPIWGQRYAMRSPANVAAEMAELKGTIKPDHLWFSDDIFGLQPRWVAEFADEVRSRDASIPFMIQSRVDLMTDKAVRALARAGCVEVWMGVESGSQKILDAMDKGTKLPQIPVARQRLKEAGIKACFFIQFGYPGETFEDVMATVRLVRDNLPDQIGVSVSYPLKGTKFYDMVERELGPKTHWHDSDELAMMFRGTFGTTFYRRLHRLLHRDLDARLEGAKGANGNPALLRELEEVDAAWEELTRFAHESQIEDPTVIEKHYLSPETPDLSRSWN